MLDFQSKSRPLHTATVDRPKNATFLGINHGLISFEKEAYKGKPKPPPTRVTLLRPLQAGWASAPYKQGQKLRGSRLYEPINGGIKFFAFEKVSNNMEKGPRSDDVSYEIHVGDTLNMWLDEKRLDEVKRDMLDDTILKIDPFTVCVVTICTRNIEGAGKGRGCKIASLRPCDFTLYSCVQDLDTFPTTLADARTQALKNQQAWPQIAEELNPTESLFRIQCDQKAYIHEAEGAPDAEMVTLVNTGIDPVDIPLPVLLRYTNCTRKEQACSLLDIAIASSALQLVVFNSEYWKTATTSHLRAVPLIDTEVLLQCVQPALVGTQTCFNTPYSMTVDDVNYQIQIHIDPVAHPSPLPAFVFTLTRSPLRSPPPSAPGPRPRAPTLCSRTSRPSSSAPTSSASPSTTRPPGKRSPACGWATSTPPRAGAPPRWAFASARSRPRTTSEIHYARRRIMI